MESIQCHMTLNNRTHGHLRLLKSQLDWGVFREGPLSDIPPMVEMKAFVATGKPDLPGGTEGVVVYQLGDDANATITLSFNVTATPGGDNTVTADTSNMDIAAQLTGFHGSGASEVCNVKVLDGR